MDFFFEIEQTEKKLLKLKEEEESENESKQSHPDYVLKQASNDPSPELTTRVVGVAERLNGALRRLANFNIEEVFGDEEIERFKIQVEKCRVVAGSMKTGPALIETLNKLKQ